VYKNRVGLTYRISREERLTYVSASGPIDLDATSRALAALVADPGFEPHFGILADARESYPAYSLTEVRALISLLAECRDKLQSRVAFVVCAGRVHSIAHMASVFAEIADFPLAAFLEVEEARTWLLDGNHARPA